MTDPNHDHSDGSVCISDPTTDPDTRAKNALAVVALARHELLQAVETATFFIRELGMNVDQLQVGIPTWNIGILFESDDPSRELFVPVSLPPRLAVQPPQPVLHGLAELLEMAKFDSEITNNLMGSELRKTRRRPLGFVLSVTAHGWKIPTPEDARELTPHIQAALGEDSTTVPDPRVFDSAVCTVAFTYHLDIGPVSMFVDENGEVSSTGGVTDLGGDEIGEAGALVERISKQLQRLFEEWVANHPTGS